MVSRREMMPLLSLIFSALFILFGTVVIQAFRSENKDFSFIKLICCTYFSMHIVLTKETNKQN